MRTSTSLARGDFPKNEYWVYSTIHDEARYLFIKGGDEWEIGTALDLVPSVVKSRMGSGGQQGGAEKLGVIFEEIYSQLATIDIDYSELYQAAESATAATVTGSDDVSRMRQFLGRSREVARRRTYARENAVPTAYSTLSDNSDTFGIQTRISRFLGEGGTRTIIDWGVPDGKADSLGEVLDVTAVYYDKQYRKLTSTSRQYSLREKEAQDGAGGTVRQTTLPATSERPYHAVVQWARRSDGGEGAVQGRQIIRVDSLSPLKKSSARLEMSDLRLFSLPKHWAASGAPTPAEGRAHPFRTVSRQTPLFLQFELYHLHRDGTGKAKYTVTYEVTRPADRNFVERLFGADKRKTTSTTTTSVRQKAQVREHIMLDLDEGGSKPQTITITVRVTDQATDQQVERDITMDLVSEKAQSS